MSFYETVEQNLVFFFKGYVVRVLLGFLGIFYCPCCESLCLEPEKKSTMMLITVYVVINVSFGITGDVNTSLLIHNKIIGSVPLGNSYNYLFKNVY